MGDYDFNFAQRLANIYKRAGKVEQARAELMRPDRTGEDRMSYDPSYAAYIQINSTQNGSNALTGLGFPTDALRLLNTALADTANLKLAEQYYGSNAEQ